MEILFLFLDLAWMPSLRWFNPRKIRPYSTTKTHQNNRNEGLKKCNVFFAVVTCVICLLANVVVSVCLERQSTAPEKSVRCGAASTVTLKSNSGKAVFVRVAASMGCWYSEGAEATLALCRSLLSSHCSSLLASALLTPVRPTWRQLLQSAEAANKSRTSINNRWFPFCTCLML